jgi:AcrR family transcriptional regulator
VANNSETRAKIIEVTERLIAQKGVDKTSLADIASALGISRGTLFYHFPSKSQLIFEIANLHIDQMTAELVKHILAERDSIEPGLLLKSALQFIMESGQTGTTLHLYLIQAAIVSDPALKAGFKTKYHEWRQLLENALAQVLPVDINVRALSYVLLAVMDGMTIQSLLGVDDIPAEEIAQYLIPVQVS